MFNNADSLESAILEHKPKDFVSHFIFEPVPFIFGGNLKAWIDWKTELSKMIEVDPYDIVITGSAAIGYSLNPHKNYKTYDSSSDIDCGVISSHHFDLSWRYLRQIRPQWLTLPKSTKRAIERHRENYVFSGTIATDSMLGLLPFGKVWQQALTVMSRHQSTLNKDVKLRIYKDYDSLRSYQAHGIDNLRLKLINTDEDISLEAASELIETQE